MKPITVMTIGGSDPSGGAGIQTDIKAFQSLGLHPVSVITSITVQNTQKVKQIIPLNPDIITDQIETIMEDIPIKYVKTGLLYHSEISKRVARAVKKYHLHLIFDPVLTATSGDLLSTSNFEKELKRTLLPLAQIITPNIPEAEKLTERSIETLENMKEASKILSELGAKSIVLKGGHLRGDMAHDVLYYGKKFTIISFPKIHNRKAHGSGCTFSALLTGFLAKGFPVDQSFSQAKASLWHMIHNGYNIGKGSDVLSVSSLSVKDAPVDFTTTEHFETWMKLYSSVSAIISEIPDNFIPEVGCNIGYAILNAKNHKDICAIDGRIVRTSLGPARCGALKFGVSKHIGSIILSAMKFYPSIRCAMNIRYRSDILSFCEKIGYEISTFDRADEPIKVSTMDWGTTNALEKSKTCPDIIYDKGGIGKEPMIRILGTNPDEVFMKLMKIVNEQKK